MSVVSVAPIGAYEEIEDKTKVTAADASDTDFELRRYYAIPEKQFSDLDRRKYYRRDSEMRTYRARFFEGFAKSIRALQATTCRCLCVMENSADDQLFIDTFSTLLYNTTEESFLARQTTRFYEYKVDAKIFKYLGISDPSLSKHEGDVLLIGVVDKSVIVYKYKKLVEFHDAMKKYGLGPSSAYGLLKLTARRGGRSQVEQLIVMGLLGVFEPCSCVLDHQLDLGSQTSETIANLREMDPDAFEKFRKAYELYMKYQPTVTARRRD